MKAANFIDAIRLIRNMPVIIEAAKSENGVAIQKVRTDISLLDAKRFVESIMALSGDNLAKLKEAQDTIAVLRNDNSRLGIALDERDREYFDLRDKLRRMLDSEN